MSITESISQDQSALCVCVIHLRQTGKPARYTPTHTHSRWTNHTPPPTWMVFPFLAVTTSPGLVALPLGMFSHSGARPAPSRNTHDVWLDSRDGRGPTEDTPTNYVHRELQSRRRHDGGANRSSSAHIGSHGVHRLRRLQRDAATASTHRAEVKTQPGRNKET